jgi:mannosyltransferase
MAYNVKDHSRYLLLCMLLISGFIIRLYQLGAESIWLDEGHSILTSKLDLLSIILRQDDVPPLYFAFLHGWIKIFGDSEFAVRFPSLIFGVFSIWFVFKIGSLLFDENKGLLAALLLTVSRFAVDYSQEVRMYSLTALLTLISMYYLIKLNKEGGKRTASIVYVLSSVLLIYSHIFGLFIIFAQNTYIITLHLFSKKETAISLKHWISMQAILFFLFLPWVPTFIARVLDDARGSYLDVPTKRIIYTTIEIYTGEYILWISLLLAFLSMATIQLIKGANNDEPLFQLIEKLKFEVRLLNPKSHFLLLLWLCIPVFLPFFLSKVLTPFYEIRYTIVAAPAFYLLVASGIGNIRRISIRSAVVVLVIAFNMLNLYDYYHDVTHEQWRTVAGYIDNHARDDDLILFNSKYCIKYAFNYYSQTQVMRKFLPKKKNRYDSNGLQDLRKLVSEHPRVWVVLSHPDEDKQFIETLNRRYQPLEFKEYRGITLYLYKNQMG